MQKLMLITAAAFLLGLSSCSHQSSHDHPQEAITLDNGKKWVMDDNMMVHVQKMADDVKLTAAQTEKDYSNLNKELKAGIDALTSDCTMKGQAHDELHKWLLPFIGTTNEFKPDMADEKKAEWFEKIQKSMADFNTYFQ